MIVSNFPKLHAHLEKLSIAGIGQWINDHNPEKNMKTLKCKRSEAIEMAFQTFFYVRSRRNKKHFGKASRRLLRYATS